jgi:predicted alpha/beta hydrolase family esterase
MKRAVIVHCYGGKPDYAWYPWLKRQLEGKGYTVRVPRMPNTDNPKLSEWLPFLKDIIGSPDEELLLVGHSLGTVVIMRYLETLKASQKVGKVILVAGFTDPVGLAALENFFETKLNFGEIMDKSASGFIVIQSDNDPYVSNQYGQRFIDELGAKLVIKQGAGHMSGPVNSSSSTTILPEVMSEI